MCIYHLFVWSNFNFLHISKRITLPTQLCIVLYSFCANLLHSLYHYYFYYLRCFHISVSWGSFTRVLVTASFLKSPGLVSVFWPILMMLWFGWSSPLISASSSPCTNSLVTVTIAPISIGTTVSFMSTCIFFSPLAKSRYLPFFSISFNFTLWSAETAILFFFFSLIIIKSDSLAVYYYYYYYLLL